MVEHTLYLPLVSIVPSTSFYHSIAPAVVDKARVSRSQLEVCFNFCDDFKDVVQRIKGTRTGYVLASYWIFRFPDGPRKAKKHVLNAHSLCIRHANMQHINNPAVDGKKFIFVCGEAKSKARRL